MNENKFLYYCPKLNEFLLHKEKGRPDVVYWLFAGGHDLGLTLYYIGEL